MRTVFETNRASGRERAGGYDLGRSRASSELAWAQRERQERLLDDGLAETFPASDPVAVMRIT